MAFSVSNSRFFHRLPANTVDRGSGGGPPTPLFHDMQWRRIRKGERSELHASLVTLEY
jgi:hypothetical protein